ncbi:hypothetical protein D3C76_772140 [compost metagenome]
MSDVGEGRRLDVVGWQPVVGRADVAVEEGPVGAGKPMQEGQVLCTGHECSAATRAAKPPGQRRAEQPQGKHRRGNQQYHRLHRQGSDQHRHQGRLPPLFAIHRFQGICTVALVLARGVPLQQALFADRQTPQGAEDGIQAVAGLEG